MSLTRGLLVVFFALMCISSVAAKPHHGQHGHPGHSSDVRKDAVSSSWRTHSIFDTIEEAHAYGQYKRAELSKRAANGIITDDKNAFEALSNDIANQKSFHERYVVSNGQVNINGPSTGNSTVGSEGDCFWPPEICFNWWECCTEFCDLGRCAYWSANN